MILQVYYRPRFYNFVKFQSLCRTLRGSSSSIVKNNGSKDVTKSEKTKNTLTDSKISRKQQIAHPAKFIKFPDKPVPVGTEKVEEWISPLANDPESIALKRDRYAERFIVADEINAELENADNPGKVNTFWDNIF